MRTRHHPGAPVRLVPDRVAADPAAEVRRDVPRELREALGRRPRGVRQPWCSRPSAASRSGSAGRASRGRWPRPPADRRRGGRGAVRHETSARTVVNPSSRASSRRRRRQAPRWTTKTLSSWTASSMPRAAEAGVGAVARQALLVTVRARASAAFVWDMCFIFRQRRSAFRAAQREMAITSIATY